MKGRASSCSYKKVIGSWWVIDRAEGNRSLGATLPLMRLSTVFPGSCPDRRPNRQPYCIVFGFNPWMIISRLSLVVLSLYSSPGFSTFNHGSERLRS
jgi:hypothetical protein